MSDDSQKNGEVSWRNWLLKQVPAYILLTAVLWFLGYKVWLPMQEKHMELIDTTVSTQHELADCYRRQTNILEEWLRKR